MLSIALVVTVALGMHQLSQPQVLWDRGEFGHLRFNADV